MADKEFKTKNGIIANGDITANGTLYLTLGSDAAGDIYTRAANGALTRVAQGANDTLLVINSTGGYIYATVNSALLANGTVSNQHISGTNSIHGSVLVSNSVGADQLVEADVLNIVGNGSITSSSIANDQINPNHINTAATFENTTFSGITSGVLTLANTTEGATLLEFATAQGWKFVSNGTGTATKLRLQPNVDIRTFELMSNDGTKLYLSVNAINDGSGIVTIHNLVANNLLDLNGYLTATGNLESNGTIRVIKATSGATAGSNEDELIIENNANAGISILTPNTAVGKISFGDSEDASVGHISYDHTLNQAIVGIGGSQKLSINSTVMSVNGGFGVTLGSDATGDIYVRSSSGTLERVAKGANGTFLGVNSTAEYQFSKIKTGISAAALYFTRG